MPSCVRDWDCDKVYTEYYSKGINTPYTGMALKGAPVCTIMGDRVVRAADLV